MAVIRILKSLIEANAEHALAQQNAVAATSDLTLATQNANGEIRQLMDELQMNLVSPSQGCITHCPLMTDRPLWVPT